MTYLGIDLSLNHAGFVLLEGGDDVVDFQYVTNIKGSADKSSRGIYMPVEKMKDRLDGDKHRLLAWRLHQMSGHVWDAVKRWTPDYVCVEDYALRAEQGSHQMGEVGGVVRWMLYSAGVPFRLHDPTSLKMFVAHDGTCDKYEVERSVEERWGIEFSRYNSGRSKDGENRQTSEDLCDAYGLAKMIQVEDRIRRGKMRLDELPSKEIRVFNRITKYQRVPLISREWIVANEIDI